MSLSMAEPFFLMCIAFNSKASGGVSSGLGTLLFFTVLSVSLSLSVCLCVCMQAGFLGVWSLWGEDLSAAV